MITFNFYLEDLSANSAHEFDLGNIEISTEKVTLTSAGKKPNQSMMIFIAASDLLYGIKNLIHKNEKYFVFVGADSSFKVTFEKGKNGLYKVIFDRNIILEISGTDLLTGAYDGVERLYNKYAGTLEGSGAAKKDIEYALGL